jgi:hypothetical protein
VLFPFHTEYWRKIQKIPEILKKYSSDSDFALNIRKFPALAFVSIQDIVTAFEELIEKDFFVKNSNTLENLI